MKAWQSPSGAASGQGYGLHKGQKQRAKGPEPNASSSRLVAAEQALRYRRVKCDVARPFEVCRPFGQAGVLLALVGEGAGLVERLELGGERWIGRSTNYEPENRQPCVIGRQALSGWDALSVTVFAQRK